MSYPDSDDRLEEALASLPRARASEQFTAEVLSTIEDRPTGHRRPSTTFGRTVLATCAALIAGIIGMAYQRQQAAEDRYREQVLELRHEYRRLLEEVAAVRNEATEPPTRLYLGGDERLDLILDLSQPEPPTRLGENLSAARDFRQDHRNLESTAHEP